MSRDSGIDTNTVASSNITASGGSSKSESQFTDIAGEERQQAQARLDIITYLTEISFNSYQCYSSYVICHTDILLGKV